MSAPSKQLDQFVVRLPDGLRDQIKTAAEVNGRSMNAEIVATLQEKYDISATWRALVNAAQNRLERLYPANGEWEPELAQAVKVLRDELNDPDLRRASTAAFMLLHGSNENKPITPEEVGKLREKFIRDVRLLIDPSA